MAFTVQGQHEQKRKQDYTKGILLATYAMPPKLKYTTEAEAEVKRIMVALVAAATSGNTPISNIKGPYSALNDSWSSLKQISNK